MKDNKDSNCVQRTLNLLKAMLRAINDGIVMPHHTASLGVEVLPGLNVIRFPGKKEMLCHIWRAIGNIRETCRFVNSLSRVSKRPSAPRTQRCLLFQASRSRLEKMFSVFCMDCFLIDARTWALPCANSNSSNEDSWFNNKMLEFCIEVETRCLLIRVLTLFCASSRLHYICTLSEAFEQRTVSTTRGTPLQSTTNAFSSPCDCTR